MRWGFDDLFISVTVLKLKVSARGCRTEGHGDGGHLDDRLTMGTMLPVGEPKMFDAIQQFRASLEEGQLQVGCGITLVDGVVCEALGDSVDFFWIDMEHTHLDFGTLKAHLIAARATCTPCLVRVRGPGIEQIKPVLDIGALGIIVPQVRSTAEVLEVVDACRYAPRGNRGFGPRGPSNYGRNAGPDYMELANDAIFVSVQIENRWAFEDLDAIVQVEELDSIILGPYDLSMSLGYGGDVKHPNVVDAMKQVAAKGRAAGKYVGMGGVDKELAVVAKSIGVQWVQCGDDFAHMIYAIDRLAADVRNVYES